MNCPPENSPLLAALTTGQETDITPSLLRQTRLETFVNAVKAANPPSLVAVRLYQKWIFANESTSDDVPAAWFNLGLTFTALGDISSAVSSYQKAWELQPSLHLAANNLGLLYENMGREDVALAIWQRALTTTDEPSMLLGNCGRVMERQKRYDEAATYLRASLAENPDQPYIHAYLTLMWQRMCLWEELPPLREKTLPPVTPLGALALYDDIALQSEIAATWLARSTPPAPKLLCPPEGYNHTKIRIGYLSSDFRLHPVSFLMAEVFENHDRQDFEIHGYCTGRDDKSAFRRRVMASFDQAHQLKGASDEASARLIREHEIDILVDLNGLTTGAREGLLRWKPAPVQVSYLGYIGSVPLPELDYLLCDDYVIPPEVASLYQPKPLSLGGVYQPNDNRVSISPLPSRDSLGLPVDKFVYGCFSSHHKITEPIFSAWMEILRQSEESVLWLAEDNTWSESNLRAAAVARGIPSSRLIFASQVVREDYLARLPLVDLFLDTSPYNTGTVASDVLRMGVPLLTVAGKSFVARMAGSLLSALGLETLIAANLADYVQQAVDLAQDRQKLAIYRHALAGERWQRTLGDTMGFTARLEEAYRRIRKGGY